MMTRTLALYALIAAAVLATTALLVIAAWIARDGGPDEDDWADDDLDAMYNDDPDDAAGEHYHIAGWGGLPGECGVECACGTTFDSFDTLAAAMELLDDHIARANAERAGDDTQRLHLAGDWTEQLTPPEVPQLDPCAARPYVDYLPRHGDDTIEFHLVPADWQPLIGARRLHAAIDQTEQIEAVR